MRGSELLDKMGLVDPVYLQEAERRQGIAKRGWVRWAAAACLCLVAVFGFFFSYRMSIGESKCRHKENPIAIEIAIENIEDMEELSSLYDGTLLAEKLVPPDAESATIQLSHVGAGNIADTSGWRTLSVSAQYSDYSVVINCSFQGSEENSSLTAPADTMQYGDTTVFLYREEPMPELEYIYRAVFEYEGVFYELSTQSNDPDRIYDMLDRVLGGSVTAEPEGEAADGSGFVEPDEAAAFTDILGFSDYRVSIEESTPNFFIWRYYVEIDGKTQCIASTSGSIYSDEEPEAYSVDLDNDGVAEFVCNTIYGTGAERVSVFRNNNGVIEEGFIKERELETQFHMDLTWGAGSISQKYDPTENAFVVTGPAEDGSTMTVSFQGLDYFYFGPFFAP